MATFCSLISMWACVSVSPSRFSFSLCPALPRVWPKPPRDIRSQEHGNQHTVLMILYFPDTCSLYSLVDSLSEKKHRMAITKLRANALVYLGQETTANDHTLRTLLSFLGNFCANSRNARPFLSSLTSLLIPAHPTMPAGPFMESQSVNVTVGVLCPLPPDQAHARGLGSLEAILCPRNSSAQRSRGDT